MHFWDFLAETLHQRLGTHKLLCSIGLHHWGYTGKMDRFPVNRPRHLWTCAHCYQEKWLKTEWR